MICKKAILIMFLFCIVTNNMLFSVLTPMAKWTMRLLEFYGINNSIAKQNFKYFYSEVLDSNVIKTEYKRWWAEKICASGGEKFFLEYNKDFKEELKKFTNFDNDRDLESDVADHMIKFGGSNVYSHLLQVVKEDIAKNDTYKNKDKKKIFANYHYLFWCGCVEGKEITKQVVADRVNNAKKFIQIECNKYGCSASDFINTFRKITGREIIKEEDIKSYRYYLNKYYFLSGLKSKINKIQSKIPQIDINLNCLNLDLIKVKRYGGYQLAYAFPLYYYAQSDYYEQVKRNTEKKEVLEQNEESWVGNSKNNNWKIDMVVF